MLVQPSKQVVDPKLEELALVSREKSNVSTFRKPSADREVMS